MASDEVRSVARALDALDLLGQAAPRGVRVTDVASALGIDPGTASRLLGTLAGKGYASKLPDRRYTLGARSLRLATAWIDALVEQAGSHLVRLAEATGTTAHLLQMLGGHAVTIARIAPGDQPRASATFAGAYPLWAAAAGHALLSALPPAQRLGLLPVEPYPVLTSQTPCTWADVWHGLERGMREGIFSEQGQLHPCIGCLAVPLPISDRGEVLALAVSFELDRIACSEGRLRSHLVRASHGIACEV